MADSEWVLNIAAEMPDGAATIAELDAMTDRLVGATKRSDDFQAAVKSVTVALDAAKMASSQAAAALAQGSEQYRLLERDAIRTSKALENAQAKGRFDPRAALAAHDASTALTAYTSTLKRLEDASAAANGEQARLAKQLANVTKLGAHADARNAALSQRFEKLGVAVGRLPGPLGMVGSRLVGAAKAGHEARVALGASTAATLALAAGAALAVFAVVALTVALVAGVVAFTNYAVAQADAARTAALSREAFAALSAENAAAVNSFDAVAQATGLADAELVKLAKQLKAAEVSAADMPAALRAAALAERALGSGGASEFVERVRAGELAVGAFAAEVESKFGGIVVEQLRGLDAQSARFAKAWKSRFAGINLDPFLDGLGVLVGMFEKGHPLAEAFGLGVEGAINPIGDLFLQAAYGVEAFALGFAIQLTKMYLAAKPAIKWLGELFGASEGTALLDTLAKIGEVAAIVALVIGGGLALAFGVVGGMFAFAASVAAGFALAVYGVVNTMIAVGQGLYAIGAIVVEQTLKFATLGYDLMMGLVSGIMSAVGAVVTAVSDAVGAAIVAAKEVLGIASPSKVFAEIGTNTADGFTSGVEAGTPEAQGSMAAMVGPDGAAGGASTGAQASAGGGGTRSLNFAGATFNFHGVKNAENARDLFSEMLTRLFEDDADSLGGAEPEPA